MKRKTTIHRKPIKVQDSHGNLHNQPIILPGRAWSNTSPPVSIYTDTTLTVVTSDILGEDYRRIASSLNAWLRENLPWALYVNLKAEFNK